METLLKQRMQRNQNRISEMEEFVDALPEICDCFCEIGWKIDSQNIMFFLRDLMEPLEEKRIEELLKQENFIKYPKIAQLVQAIYEKNMQYF